MSGENKDRLCRLLHSYELGLLEGDQLDEFEQHIIVCPDCRAQAESFLPAATLLRHDPEIKGLVEGLQQPVSATKHRGFWPAFLAVAAAVIILILRPWNLQFQPSQDVTASENRLAIMYVAGPSDSEAAASLGQTAAGLLIADLSESKYLRVVSSQRMYDAARHLGLSDPNRIAQSDAAAVAREVGARWMLTAGLVGDSLQQRLVTQLFDVATGEVEASQGVVVDSSTSVFALVDQLSVQLKGDLGLPQQAFEEPDPNVADLTSHSVEAYKLYLKGIELVQRVYLSDAVDCFHKAVELDSSFAMAYYYLSLFESSEVIAKAVTFSSRATRKGQMFIAAQAAMVKKDTTSMLTVLRSLTEQYPDEKDAFYQLGQYYFNHMDYDLAVFYMEKSLALDPLHRLSYNHLAYCYDEMGRLDEAFSTLDEYERIAPDEPNPHDTRADILARNGRLDDAIDAYSEAVKKDSSFGPSRSKLYYACLADGRYDQADEIYKDWESKCAEKGCANTYWTKSTELIYRGRLREGLAWLDRAIAEETARSSDKPTNILDFLYSSKAQTLLALDSAAAGDAEMAIRYLLKAMPDDKLNFRITFVRALAHDGLVDSAARVVEQMKQDIKAKSSSWLTYWVSKGYFELERHDYKNAVESFDSAATLTMKGGAYLVRYLQGQALLMAGQAAQAVTVLAEQENSYSEFRTRDCYTSSRLYYYLGRAYEASGRVDSAITRYEKFLGIWENADPDLKEFVDARERLARLKTNP